ncbi:MAG: hypothetical protein K0U64_12410 [Actinomycetia bacterium]|nr:hypothetical protein [Actinomycetes bacterium]
MTALVTAPDQSRKRGRGRNRRRNPDAGQAGRSRTSRPPRQASGVKGLPRLKWKSAPFAGLVAALLAAGLVALLLVNNSLAAGSFEQASLKAEKTLLFEREQGLNQEVLALSSPTQLRLSARQLGMVPAATTVYLDLLTGQIRGVPKPAKGAAAPAPANPAAPAAPAPAAPAPAAPVAPDTQAVPPQAATPQTETGDGASVSSGTAYDRAIVSGAGE